MAKCHTNNIGSLLLDHTSTTATATGTHHSRLWTAFSRKIFDAVSCGGSSRYRHYEDDIPSFTTTATNATASVSREKQNKTALSVTNNSRKEENGNQQNLNVEGEKGRVKARNGKSEKLSDLLSMAEAESEIETRKKVEVLEGMKRVVRELQVDEGVKRREAACNVRLLCKEDGKARVTLSMLGAIPPLVGMLDLEDFECQIDALYALLNLGIGNDV
jgi:hypothetical protein